MSVASFLRAISLRLSRWRPRIEAVPEAVYRDLVETVFTMRAPIIGLGCLYALVGCLILSVWPDPIIAALTLTAIGVTATRVWLIQSYFRSGGSSQSLDDLCLWERRYARATYVFALLLAGLAARSLALHQPIVHMTVISLIFTFGAGVVSRTAGRPAICTGGVVLAVGPTSLAFLLHAFSATDALLQTEFYVLQAVLLAVVGAMSLGSARHQYNALVDHLVAEHDMGQLARSDPLTGLPNRLLLREAFRLGVDSSAVTGRPLAVHYLDLDGFKAINDGYGHPAGDAVLREVARRLNETVRAGDTASRLGGDEFVLVQVGVEHPSEAEMLARRIIRTISAPYLIDGRELRISVSIGIAMSPEFGTDLEDLIACADAALYRSKAGGKAQLHFFSAEEKAEAAPAAA